MQTDKYEYKKFECQSYVFFNEGLKEKMEKDGWEILDVDVRHWVEDYYDTIVTARRKKQDEH